MAVLQEGGVLGPYQLLRRLGQGGAGEVFLANRLAGTSATQGGLQQVAIKVIAGSASDPTTQRIVREAQAIGRLQQPHIIPFYEVISDADTLAVVSAFAGGGSLGDTLRTTSANNGQARLTLPLSAAIVARLVSQLAAALDAAHAQGLTHGDIKPNNVFVRTSPTGRPLAALGDFGQAVLMGAAAAILARATQSNEQTHWAANQLLFAAPEQLDGMTTPLSDQYGLAALAYFLLTSKPPIVSDDPSMLQAVRQQPVPLPSQFNTSLAPAVDVALLRALAKSSDQRFPSLSDFAQTLREALAVQGATGVTQQFSQLAGADEGYTAGRAGQNVAGVAGVQLLNMTGATTDDMNRLEHQAQQSAGIPDPSPRMNKRLTIIASVALLLTILACVFTGEALNASSVLPRINLGNGGNSASTSSVPTPNATQQAQANAAVNELREATQQSPVFSDGLTNNSHNWSTDGKTLYFKGGGFHISTLAASTSVGVDTPTNQLNLTNLVAQVTVKFATGPAGDFAGLRFFVNSNSDGTEDYYCFLVSIEGRYAIWEHQGDGQPAWNYISGGYVNALHTGLNQANTLTVLAIGSGNSPRALFFANGQYISTITLKQSSIQTSGGSGLMVFDEGIEAVFTDFNLYNARNVH